MSLQTPSEAHNDKETPSASTANAGLLTRLKGIQAPWVWSFAGAILVWFAIVTIFGFSIASNVAQTALIYGVFMVLVGLGQMLVITSGVGNIDLSVPSTIALAGVVSMHVMNGSNNQIALGLAAVVGVGIAVGLANYALIRLLRIPPIIATLSSSFIIQSLCEWSLRACSVYCAGGAGVVAFAWRAAASFQLRTKVVCDRAELTRSLARRCRCALDTLHCVRVVIGDRGVHGAAACGGVRRRVARHGRGVHADIDRRGRDRRHARDGRKTDDRRRVGRVDVPVPHERSAQRSRRGCGCPVDRVWSADHCRDGRGGRQGAALSEH
jgi:hypothetical protein